MFIQIDKIQMNFLMRAVNTVNTVNTALVPFSPFFFFNSNSPTECTHFGLLKKYIYILTTPFF